MQKLEITELGNEILRTEAENIDIQKIKDNETKTLIEDMKYTLSMANGLGIAAPQINVSAQLFIVASRPNKRYPQAPTCDPFAVINPVILETSSEIVKDWEGCLSIPGIRGLVPRYKHIKVKYYDETGQEQYREFRDFLARIFQHEYDHLQGIVFLDRLESMKDLVTEKEYFKKLQL